MGGVKTWGGKRAGSVPVGSGLRTLGKAPPPCDLGRGAVASMRRAHCCSFCGPRSVFDGVLQIVRRALLLCRAECSGRCAPPSCPFRRCFGSD